MNKIKAAFAGNNADSINYVFGDTRINAIRELTDLNPEALTSQNFNSGKFADTEVLFSTWGMPVLSDDDLKCLPALKAVFYAAGATSQFHYPFLRRGVLVSSAWHANAIPVAEFAFAQIVLALKNYFTVTRLLKETHQFYGQPVGPGAYDTTVALIGNGAVSTRLQSLLKSLNVNVFVVPTHCDNRAELIAKAFQTAQVVSNHLPDTEVDTGVFNATLFQSMPQNAVFINTGRGRQVVESDLVSVLTERTDLSALLDVTFPEPPPTDSPLFSLPNIHISPHIAGSLNLECRRMADSAIEEFKRYRDGQPLLYHVPKD